MPRQRDNRAVFARRNVEAQAEGWASYGQRRYWVTRWSREVAEQLGLEACGGHKEESRGGSILCASCNAIVNPNVASTPGVAPRRGDWRARLVRLVLELRAQRRQGAPA